MVPNIVRRYIIYYNTIRVLFNYEYCKNLLFWYKYCLKIRQKLFKNCDKKIQKILFCPLCSLPKKFLTIVGSPFSFTQKNLIPLFYLVFISIAIINLLLSLFLSQNMIQKCLFAEWYQNLFLLNFQIFSQLNKNWKEKIVI